MSGYKREARGPGFTVLKWRREGGREWTRREVQTGCSRSKSKCIYNQAQTATSNNQTKQPLPPSPENTQQDILNEGAMCESVKEWIHYELCRCVVRVHVMRDGLVRKCANAMPKTPW